MKTAIAAVMLVALVAAGLLALSVAASPMKKIFLNGTADAQDGDHDDDQAGDQDDGQVGDVDDGPTGDVDDGQVGDADDGQVGDVEDPGTT